ncbi:MAG: hypothetical protein DRO06_01780 [Thermoproteota archaeon]|nr:MAG: hypothetical protein DRO06_01780 [Candidatus Korarchaeota archaeon]
MDLPVLLSSVLIPFAGSLALPAVKRGKAACAVAVILLAVPLAVTTWAWLTEGTAVDPPVAVLPGVGMFSALVDPLSAPLILSICLVTAAIAVYSLPYMEHRYEEMEREGESAPGWGVYYMLYVMFSVSMVGTVLSTNLVEFYLFLELSLLPSFLLIAFYGYGNRERIALMYLIWTHVGALAFLLGALTVGLTAGTFDFYDPVSMTPALGLGEVLSPGMRTIVALAMCLGLFVKLAIFGVHIWLPYAHAEAPTPVSALLSPNLIGIAAYALVRLVYTMFPAEFAALSPWFLGLAVLTIVYGGLMALAQDDFKRMLAYSSISQMGYLLMGVATLTPAGVAGSMVHYAAHAVGKALLFATAGVLIVRAHTRSLSALGGMAPKMPYTASLALLGFMHITGVPPSLGLWSEILILMGVAQVASSGPSVFWAFLAALLVGMGLSTAYSFITMRRIFFGRPSKAAEHAEEAGPGLLGVLRGLRGPAEEYPPHGDEGVRGGETHPDQEGRQERPEHGRAGGGDLGNPHEYQDLAPQPQGRRHPCYVHEAQEGQRRGVRHLGGHPPEGREAPGVGPHYQDPGGGEEEGLPHGVGRVVDHGAGHPGRGEGGDPHQEVAHLGYAGVGQHPLEVVLRQGHEPPVHYGEHREAQEPGAERGELRREHCVDQPDQGVRGYPYQVRGEQGRHRGRGLGVGVGQPYVDPEYGQLDEEPEAHGQSHDRPHPRAQDLPQAQGGRHGDRVVEVEGPGGEPHCERAQEEGQGPHVGPYEVHQGYPLPVSVPVEGYEQEAREQGELEEQVELHQVGGEDRPHHGDGEHDVQHVVDAPAGGGLPLPLHLLVPVLHVGQGVDGYGRRDEAYR